MDDSKLTIQPTETSINTTFDLRKTPEDLFKQKSDSSKVKVDWREFFSVEELTEAF